MIMKTTLLFLFVFLGTMNYAQSIHFNYTNGTNVTYNLEDVRKITFDADVMNLYLWDGSVYSWNVSTIGDYQYDESTQSIHEILNSANFWNVNVYPNPTSSKLTVSFNLPQADEVSINLYDIQGNLILSKDTGHIGIGKHQELLDLTDIPPGTYTCSISGQKNMIAKQLIKQ